jgi:hypothetical protein
VQLLAPLLFSIYKYALDGSLCFLRLAYTPLLGYSATGCESAPLIWLIDGTLISGLPRYSSTVPVYDSFDLQSARRRSRRVVRCSSITGFEPSPR